MADIRAAGETISNRRGTAGEPLYGIVDHESRFKLNRRLRFEVGAGEKQPPRFRVQSVFDGSASGFCESSDCREAAVENAHAARLIHISVKRVDNPRGRESPNPLLGKPKTAAPLL